MNFTPKCKAIQSGMNPMTYSMYRITARMVQSKSPFAVFATGDYISLSDSATKSYEIKLKADRKHLVGVYDHRANVEDILADLKEHLA